MKLTQQTPDSNPLAKFDFEHTPFGVVFADHMLLCDCISGVWEEPQIIPYGQLSYSPSFSALHHGQSIFEGLKVSCNDLGEPVFFRLSDNFSRMNKSAERMCMPQIPEHVFMDGIKQLIKTDKAWVPAQEGFSLYVRPVYFSNDFAIGVKPATNYRFIVFTTPIGKYFKEPLKVWVEQQFSRSAEGGTGYAKAAGNYGGGMYPTKLAQENGYQQVIWTDARENKFVEESGAMNLAFVIGNALCTPPLSHSKLAGITRDSLLRLAQEEGMEVKEENISVDQILAWHDAGLLKECFGVGTAVNIAPICRIGTKDRVIDLPLMDDNSVGSRLGEKINAYRRGRLGDPFGWLSSL